MVRNGLNKSIYLSTYQSIYLPIYRSSYLYHKLGHPPPHPPLINFWIFKSRSKKKIEQCKTYLSIRNSIKSNETDFSECFRFQCHF